MRVSKMVLQVKDSQPQAWESRLQAGGIAVLLLLLRSTESTGVLGAVVVAGEDVGVVIAKAVPIVAGTLFGLCLEL